jgi:AcrR family transcriptional regulator
MSKADLTKRALSEALSEQLKEKPFEQITVTDIARKAGLNRQTFYYHFHSLSDLATWQLRQEIQSAESVVASRDWDARLLYALNSLYTHRNIIDLSLRGMNSSTRAEVYDIVKGELGLVAMRLVDEALAGTDVSPADKALMARFYAAGFLEIVSAWIDDGIQEPPERLSRRLSRLLAGSIRGTREESNALLTNSS